MTSTRRRLFADTRCETWIQNCLRSAASTWKVRVFIVKKENELPKREDGHMKHDNTQVQMIATARVVSYCGVRLILLLLILWQCHLVTCTMLFSHSFEALDKVCVQGFEIVDE